MITSLNPLVTILMGSSIGLTPWNLPNDHQFKSPRDHPEG